MARRRHREELARLADEDLLVLADRDQAAFEALYDRHVRVAYSLAIRLLGDRQAAEDLVQEAFLAVWRGSTKYSQARGSVRTWLLSIVHHRAIDRLRQSSAMDRRQGALEEEARAQRAQDTADTAIGRVEAQAVRSALAGVPSDQLEVIRLAYYGGLTQQEIAEQLSLPLGTVKSRMRLGLERMRRNLGGGEVATA
ncbi:MAG TPA: sigma-70 family RNA polymerase sigma factor [Miltoncostaeaceae bacterium]|nr:sigma-70 family RNA polymerase sigma factor [Miltoncostaeaceae bacterium]